jgi:hypothetical protein
MFVRTVTKNLKIFECENADCGREFSCNVKHLSDYPKYCSRKCMMVGTERTRKAAEAWRKNKHHSYRP